MLVVEVKVVVEKLNVDRVVEVTDVEVANDDEDDDAGQL